MTPMLGTSCTRRFGITTRSRASSCTSVTWTTGSGYGYSAMTAAPWLRDAARAAQLRRFQSTRGPASRPTPDSARPDTVRVSSLVMDLRSLRYFVAVAEERHFGRAAARLHMTQPPLSRAIRQLETDLGAVLLHRSPAGVTLTAAGTALYDEARTLLEQAEHARARVAAAAGTATFTIGILADSAEEAGTRLAAAFRQRHPGGRASVIREADFTDPTAGLRAGLVDVALTRAPFDRHRDQHPRAALRPGRRRAARRRPARRPRPPSAARSRRPPVVPAARGHRPDLARLLERHGPGGRAPGRSGRPHRPRVPAGRACGTARSG